MRFAMSLSPRFFPPPYERATTIHFGTSLVLFFTRRWDSVLSSARSATLMTSCQLKIVGSYSWPMHLRGYTDQKGYGTMRSSLWPSHEQQRKPHTRIQGDTHPRNGCPSAIMRRWNRSPTSPVLSAMIKLYESQIEPLLNELCVRLGFCLPPVDQARLTDSPPTNVNAFTDAVFIAEGMDPNANPHLRQQVVACVAAHFAKAEEGDHTR